METKIENMVFSFIKKHKELSGLFRQYQDYYLLIDSITDQDAILLGILIADDWLGKCGSADLTVLKELFSFLGRRIDNFWTNKSNLTKQGLVDEKDSKFFITVKGLKTLENHAGVVKNSSVHIIKAGENFTAVELFKVVVADLPKSDQLMLVDEYISHETLLPFSGIKGKFTTFRIITSNIYEDKDNFKYYLEKFEKQTGIKVVVAISNRSHDRFLIAGDKCLAIGSSIKDIGNKDTLIIDISMVNSSMKELFESRWKDAEKCK